MPKDQPMRKAKPASPVSAETVEATTLLALYAEQLTTDYGCEHTSHYGEWCPECRRGVMLAIPALLSALASAHQRAEQLALLAEAHRQDSELLDAIGVCGDVSIREAIEATKQRAEQAERDKVTAQDEAQENWQSIKRLTAERDALTRELAALREAQAWRPIEAHDGSRDAVIIAVDCGTAVFVGEGFYDRDTADWWWANETPGDYFASSIQREKGWRVIRWQPLPPVPGGDGKEG